VLYLLFGQEFAKKEEVSEQANGQHDYFGSYAKAKPTVHRDPDRRANTKSKKLTMKINLKNRNVNE